MNAHTAPQSHTTQKTNIIDIAPTATTSTAIRIDSFIKQKLTEARSGVGSGIIEDATRAKQLGFASSANVRYSEFLELFRSSTPLTRHYANAYPSSLYLSWEAFHALLKAMNLWVDLPAHYLGAVPGEQLPWMEVFELAREDEITWQDFAGLIPGLPKASRDVFLDLIGAPVYSRETFPWELSKRMRAYWTEAARSFFVVAPQEAFSTSEDWLKRFRSAVAEAQHLIKIPPDDPLVVRFCRGGVLVVAAWGDEAAFLNQAAVDAKV
jgi:hypothetical protein